MRSPILLPLVLLLGCGGDDATSDTSATPDTDTDLACLANGLTVEAGVGVFGFEPIQDGDPVRIVKGPQGGWHVEVAGSVTGATASITVAPKFTLLVADMVISGADPDDVANIGLVGYDTATCGGTFFNVYSIFDDQTVQMPGQEFICNMAGQDLLYELTITDLSTGATATDSVTVKAVPDPQTNNCP